MTRLETIDGVLHVIVEHDGDKAVADCGLVGIATVGGSRQDPATGRVTHFPVCAVCDCPHSRQSLLDRMTYCVDCEQVLERHW